MGIAVQEVRGGTRIAIETIAPASQAERLGVPIGGLVVSVDGRRSTGMRLAAVGKLLAAASRPCTIQVLMPDANSSSKGGAASSAPAAADADGSDGGSGAAAPPRAGPTRVALLAAGCLSRSFLFGPGPLGVTLREEGGAVVVDTVSAGSSAEQEGVEVDGVLVALNGAELLGLSKPEVGRMLSRAPRPRRSTPIASARRRCSS